MFNMYAAGLCSGAAFVGFATGDLFWGSMNLICVILNIWCVKS